MAAAPPQPSQTAVAPQAPPTPSDSDVTAGTVSKAERDFDAEVGDVHDTFIAPKEEGVHFCLLAEFDIDAGATLAHQYPYPTGTEEHRLAELMLPDGAHLRGEDWTVFYLGQTESMSVSPMLSHEDKARTSKRATMIPPSERPRRGTVGGGLLYVLNCVRMKEDKSVRRGAMVKAMAIATPYPYIGIYKPLLLLALEEYFNNPSPDVLSKLYDSANAISTAGMPKLTRYEKILLRQSDRKDLFESRFGLHLPQDAGDNMSVSEQTTEVAAPTPAAAPDANSVNSSQRTRAPSTASSTRPAITRKDSGASSQVYGSYNDHTPTRRGVPRDTHFFETEAKFRKITVPIRIPMTVLDEDVGDYSIIELVQTFSQHVGPFQPPFHPSLHTNGAYTHPVFLIFNAILANKRVIFLGHGLPANQVARMVLAACAMVSGCGQVLRGFTENAFPYANLASLDVLEEFDGFVAGVCNPRFEELPSTWDVLCNVETGRVTVSKELPIPTVNKSDISSERSMSTLATKDEDAAMAGKTSSVSKSDCIDNQFIEEILSASTQHYGEQHIRVRWTDYVSRFVRLVAYQEQLHLGSTRLGYHYNTFREGQLGSGIVFIDDDLRQRELRGNAHRIDAWRKTKSYRLAQKDWVREQEHAPIRGFDALHNIKRLRMTRSMTNKEAELIFQTMVRQVRTYDQVVEVLCYLPMHFGGLIPIANGLLHPLANVRNNCLDLLATLQSYTVGFHALLTLNYFLRKTFIDMLERREARRNAQQRRIDDAPAEKTPGTARAGELAAQQQQQQGQGQQSQSQSQAPQTQTGPAAQQQNQSQPQTQPQPLKA